MPSEVSEEDAIRRILLEGTCPDYADVTNAVQRRFGLLVGSARVEEVVRAMRQEVPGQTLPKPADTESKGGLQKESTAAPTMQHEATVLPANAPQAGDDVLKFVEAMGGFDAARAAITDLENSLRNLMK